MPACAEARAKTYPAEIAAILRKHLAAGLRRRALWDACAMDAFSVGLGWPGMAAARRYLSMNP